MVASNGKSPRQQQPTVLQYDAGELKDFAKDPRELYEPDASPRLVVYDARPDMGYSHVVHTRATKWTAEIFILCDFGDLHKVIEPMSRAFRVITSVQADS